MQLITLSEIIFRAMCTIFAKKSKIDTYYVDLSELLFVSSKTQKKIHSKDYSCSLAKSLLSEYFSEIFCISIAFRKYCIDFSMKYQ